MIFAHSRYESSRLVFSKAADGTPKQVIEFPKPRPLAFTAVRHVVREYERLDMLAARYYADPEMWWVIAEANPQIFYPEDLVPGTPLRIPRAPALR